MSVRESARQPTCLPSLTTKVSVEPGPNNDAGTETHRDSDKGRLLYSGELARICTRTEMVSFGRVQRGGSATSTAIEGRLLYTLCYYNTDVNLFSNILRL